MDKNVLDEERFILLVKEYLKNDDLKSFTYVNKNINNLIKENMNAVKKTAALQNLFNSLKNVTDHTNKRIIGLKVELSELKRGDEFVRSKLILEIENFLNDYSTIKLCLNRIASAQESEINKFVKIKELTNDVKKTINEIEINIKGANKLIQKIPMIKIINKDVMEHIFSYLDIASAINLGKTCIQFKNEINSSKSVDNSKIPKIENYASKMEKVLNEMTENFQKLEKKIDDLSDKSFSFDLELAQRNLKLFIRKLSLPINELETFLKNEGKKSTSAKIIKIINGLKSLQSRANFLYETRIRA